MNKQQLLSRIAELEAENARLETENHQLKHDPAFGMLTKEGLRLEYHLIKPDGQYLVFCDLNNIHDWNAALGEPCVDSIIKQAFQFYARHTDVKTCGRGESGDEIAVIITGNPDEFVVRMMAEIEAAGNQAIENCVPINLDMFAKCKNRGFGGMAAYESIDDRDFAAILESARSKVRTQKSVRGNQER